MTGESGGDAHLPGGLMVSQDGYTLTSRPPGPRPAGAVPLAFTVTGPDGAPVTDVRGGAREAAAPVVVRRDGTGFQHVHPEQDADGRWTTAVDLVPGDWRVLADFVPAGGAGLTLGADLAVARRLRPAAARTGRRARRRSDGYTVTLDGDLTAGTDAAPHPDRDARRRAGDRPAALPRRLRPPGRPARRRPRLPARAPRRGHGTAGPEVGSSPRCRAPAATTSTSTSGTATGCARREFVVTAGGTR